MNDAPEVARAKRAASLMLHRQQRPEDVVVRAGRRADRAERRAPRNWSVTRLGKAPNASVA